MTEWWFKEPKVTGEKKRIEMKVGGNVGKKSERPLSYSEDVMLRAEKYISTYLYIVAWRDPQFRKPKMWKTRRQAGIS